MGENGIRGRSRIYCADPSVRECEAVQENLSNHYECVVFHNLPPCFNTIDDEEFELLIIDVSLLDIEGQNPLAAFRQRHPTLPIIAIGQSVNISQVVRLIKNGVDDFIPKPFDRTTLITKTTAILNERNGNGLTRNEKQILDLIIQGKSNKEIAVLLHRSIRTIEDHRSNLMKKINAANLVDVVKYALCGNSVI
jgi:FixJ family two-component response regulator